MRSATARISSPYLLCFFFSSRRRHTRLQGDWSSDVCSSDLIRVPAEHEFFDYQAKYFDPATVFDLPARIEPHLVEVLQDGAVRAFRALECSEIGRASCRERV